MNELKHVAVITDGNGRWATRRGLPRNEGHTAGKKTFQNLCDWCLELGIPYMTFYVLSLENLKRDPAEIEHIHNMARELSNKDGIAQCNAKGIRMVYIGDRSMLPQEDREAYELVERKTAGNSKLICMMATHYGGRDEIVKAARACVDEGVEITEESICAHMYAAPVGAPDPDLIIRTGEFQRLSGFLTWESIYSELYFTPTLFPDLSREEFAWACKWYEGIERTHGGDRKETVRPAAERKASFSAVPAKNAVPFAAKKDMDQVSRGGGNNGDT